MPYIKIDIHAIEESIKSKDAFNALCLATFFKARYANSVVYKHSAREIKAITHLGTERLSKCLKTGQRLGLLFFSGDSMRITKLHRSCFRYICIERGSSFKDIAKVFRKGLILNKVNQINFVKNMVVKADSPDSKFTKNELRKYRRIKTHVNFANKESLGTIRKSSLARLVNISKSSTGNLLKEMKLEGLIEIRPTFVQVGLSDRKVDLSLLNMYRDSWYMTRRGSDFYFQTGNTYIPLVVVK